MCGARVVSRRGGVGTYLVRQWRRRSACGGKESKKRVVEKPGDGDWRGVDRFLAFIFFCGGWRGGWERVEVGGGERVVVCEETTVESSWKKKTKNERSKLFLLLNFQHLNAHFTALVVGVLLKSHHKEVVELFCYLGTQKLNRKLTVRAFSVF